MAFSPETYALLKGQGGGSGGSDLPSVTADDNGKVLSVVNGAWAADNVFFNISATDGVLNKTWTEIYDAISVGKVCRLIDSYETGVIQLYVEHVYEEDGVYLVRLVGVNSNWFQTTTANGYPEYFEDS